MSEQGMDGLPMLIDPDAQSTDSTLPAFLSPPDDAQAYYGFR